MLKIQDLCVNLHGFLDTHERNEAKKDHIQPIGSIDATHIVLDK